MSRAQTSTTFGPFEEILERIQQDGITTWAEIQLDVLDAIERFDELHSSGNLTQGGYQSKARYFNDVLVALLSTAAGTQIAARGKRRSVLFDLIDIDICFPIEGDPIVAGEAKALGTPPHPGNNQRARGAKSDLHKRVREVALTSMDIKAAHTGPRRINSFQDWVATAQPAYISFWALRVDGAGDLSRCRSILYSLRNYCDQVGAFIYEPTATPTSYTIRHFPELSMDRAINEFAQRILSGG